MIRLFLSLTAQAAGKLEKKGRRGRGSHVVLKKKLAGRDTALGQAGDGKARLGCPRGREPRLGGRGRWQGQDAWRLSVPLTSTDFSTAAGSIRDWEGVAEALD